MLTKRHAGLVLIVVLSFIELTNAQVQDFNSTSNNNGYFHPYPIPTNDLQLLIGFNVEKKFLKRFEASLNYQTRFDEFMSSFQAALIEGGLQYRLGKFVVFKTAFRQGWVSEKDFHGWSSGTGTRQRIMFATYFKWKKKEFPLKFQVRLRIDNEWVHDRYDNVKELTVLRPRVQLEWNASKVIDPYLMAEPFFNIRDIGYDLFRFEAGLRWKMGKVVGLDTFYRVEVLNNYYSTTYHIIGVVWNFKFK